VGILSFSTSIENAAIALNMIFQHRPFFGDASLAPHPVLAPIKFVRLQ
jgi:hypothetical protein